MLRIAYWLTTMNLRGLIQPVFSYSVIPRRWSRRRVVPPEFLKRYIPKIDTKSLEKLQEKYNTISSSTLLDPKLVCQDHDIPRLYPELLPHNLDPRYRDRLRERLERREMMLRRRNLHIPEFYVGRFILK
ncbi:hypothetical protein EG68_09140 [Paragonimus skrjabini miyazakii]|uniref:Uncharacterized protein n=1 Tax=Paragonimus skrjabini miyazakii TaxID=59628 RepID=A0A8S9Y9N1_9TREM|nr:hypothetical protein EG68_09140 [Paragonimus skrjabini miyazakii]